MQIRLNDTYPITLKTLTPLAIGNERADTSFAVYHYENGDFHYLDFNRIGELDSYNQENLDEFVEQIMEGVNNNKVDFATCFEKIFKKPITTLSTQIVEGNGLDGGETLILLEILKTNGRPFVSGSTLKGVIKGELMCDYLVKNKSAVEVRNFIWAIQQVKRKDIENCYKILEHTVFGNQLPPYLQGNYHSVQRENRRFFSLFRVTDSSTTNTWEVSLMKRLRFTDGEMVIPYLTEHITANRTFNFDIQIDRTTPFYDQLPVSFIRNNDGIMKLFKILNQNAKYFLEHEIAVLKNVNGLAAGNYLNHCQQLLEQIGENAYEAILRIGSGKTFYNVSLAMAIHQINSQAYAKYLEIYCKKEKENDFESPYTRALTFNQMPLGWVKLNIDEKSICQANVNSQKAKIDSLFR